MVAVDLMICYCGTKNTHTRTPCRNLPSHHNATIHYNNPLHHPVFAPTNEAFRRFGIVTDQQVEFFTQGGGKDTLMDILLFHVAEGRHTYMDLNCTSPLQMLNGDMSRTKCPSPNTKQQSGASNIVGSQPSIVIDDVSILL